MKRVGITGNIGSGKTTVCKVFETIGIPVFYADELARSMLQEPEVVNSIVQAFGNSVLSQDGKINRTALAQFVFNNKESLQQLNQIIHPLVRGKFEDWAAARYNFPYIIQEAAILVETGLYKNFDKIIVVSAPETVRIKRVMERDGVSESDVRARGANQLPQEMLEEKADFIIFNNGNTSVISQVLEIDRDLREVQQTSR